MEASKWYNYSTYSTNNTRRVEPIFKKGKVGTDLKEKLWADSRVEAAGFVSRGFSDDDHGHHRQPHALHLGHRAWWRRKPSENWVIFDLFRFKPIIVSNIISVGMLKPGER